VHLDSVSTRVLTYVLQPSLCAQTKPMCSNQPSLCAQTKQAYVLKPTKPMCSNQPSLCAQTNQAYVLKPTKLMSSESASRPVAPSRSVRCIDPSPSDSAIVSEPRTSGRDSD
jgi:hypothetical protein